MTDQPEEKKIIIDEDWKSQVEAEKEAAKAKQQENPASQQDAEEEMDLPPASLATLVSSLMSQTLYALGQLPDPEGELPKPQLNVARHLIDTLSVLEEKTAGNLSDEEKKILSDVLHQLRMGYVAVERQLKAG